MFVKKKPNRSGSTTVAVVRKSRGRTIYIKNFGTSIINDLWKIVENVSKSGIS